MDHDPATAADPRPRRYSRRRIVLGCGAALVCALALGLTSHFRTAAGRRQGPYLPSAAPFSLPRSFPAPDPATRSTAPPLPGEWKLTFHDEFDRSTLADVWTPHQYWADGATVGEGDEQSDPANVSLANGCLRLLARKDNRFGKPYTGALVQSGGIRDRSSRRFSFLHGYAEARIRIPQGRGLWPAFWLMPASYRDAEGEIDVMDNGTGDPNVLHASAIRHGLKEQHPHAGALPPGFHTFAVDWQPGRIAWYVDGAEWARTTDRRVIPTEPMYPIFDLAVGGDWGGPPGLATRFPALMEVDWLRVWQHP
jgi:beta-glucanase (GH16 family)